MHQFNIEDTYGDLIHSNNVPQKNQRNYLDQHNFQQYSQHPQPQLQQSQKHQQQYSNQKYFQLPEHSQHPQQNLSQPHHLQQSKQSKQHRRLDQHQIQNQQREEYQLNMSIFAADNIQKNAIFGNPHPSNSKINTHYNHNNFNTHDRPQPTNIADIHRGAGIAIGKNTRNKHVEIKNRKDPFHGSRDFQHPNHDPLLKKQLRDQQLNEYQMDPNRIARDINPNAEYMFNSHNDQIKQNEYQSMTGTDHLEPTYYDQNNYSGLEPDRMFLAETKNISNLYSVEAERDIDSSIGAYHTLNLNNVTRGAIKGVDDQTKQKRSFRNPKEEVNSNSKLWEFQFTPMTMPL